jgi:hypothetical protein
VAELVDARDLKSLDGNVVWVRVPPPAPEAARGFAWEPSLLPSSNKRAPCGHASGNGCDSFLKHPCVARLLPAREIFKLWLLVFAESGAKFCAIQNLCAFVD